MAQVTPNSCQFPASSLGDLNRLQEARDMLRLAMEKFPSDEIIPYDLACVCCALGRLEEAHEWLRRAMDVGGKEDQTEGAGRS
jgi:Flp pilus assembly protein TadD